MRTDFLGQHIRLWDYSGDLISSFSTHHFWILGKILVKNTPFLKNKHEITTELHMARD